ncbi:SulP family inorganic anion transporter [Schlesneria paludicola]|uniref:SulP family inorganic anion transporter n=1 Tax=Schlesneria paludicola TaxID=360056 RepID=UPI00029B3A78|nr:SulP family inorganic anion transporter [Schlesneria paludicola]
MPQATQQSLTEAEVPRGDVRGFKRYLSNDLLSGFLVFLIALPLCLGISLASGFPAIAGVFTAIVGAIITSLISNSELTIKGPAAGLIVIVLGAVTDFKAILGDDPDAATRAYQMALAVGFVAGIIQIAFGAFRLGFLGEFFPSSTVHGMLAAIGVIIISKQIHIVLGVMGVTGEPLHLLAKVPESILGMNPEVAVIGLVSLAILFGWPLIKNKNIRRIPPQLVVILVAIPLGQYFDLSHDHTYSLAGHEFKLGERFLVNVPKNLIAAMAHPDFTALKYPAAWKWVALFALIGSLESLLSAKAIDLLDPWKRKTNFNRDVLAVGIANTVAASIGGLPMISEIVRSKANIDNGARTRFADMWHGLFLLAFVAFVPGLIHQIPLAALAAMLVYTGFRLAHPREFLHVYHIGKEQLLIFACTLVGVLATDLLIGIVIGIAVKFTVHLINGVPIKSLFKQYLDVEQTGENTYLVRAYGSAVFSNWIPFKRQLEEIGLLRRNNLVIDLSETKLVDSSVMEKLLQMQRDFEQEGLNLTITGLDLHRQLSEHEFSTRKRGLVAMRRLTIVADVGLQEQLVTEFVRLGASGYTLIPCQGAGRRHLSTSFEPNSSLVRIEVVVTRAVSDSMLDYLRRDILNEHHVTICVETVDVVNPDQF